MSDEELTNSGPQQTTDKPPEEPKVSESAETPPDVTSTQETSSEGAAKPEQDLNYGYGTSDTDDAPSADGTTDAPQPEVTAEQALNAGKIPDIQDPDLLSKIAASRDVNIHITQFGSARGTQENKPDMLDITDKDVRRIQEVFVTPANFNPEAATKTDRRIFIITGKMQSGKFSAAVALGLALQSIQKQNYAFKIYRYRPGDRLTLNAIIKDASFPNESIVIIDEVFDCGIEQSEIELLNRIQLQDRLKSCKSFLILTTSKDDFYLGDLQELKVGAVDLEQVFERHLEYHFPADMPDQETREIIDANREKLIARLTRQSNPLAAIRIFFQRAEDQLPTTEDDLVSIFDKAIEPNRRIVNQWFRSLTLNERLFAMLALLFEGMDVFSLDELYNLSVILLRASEGLRGDTAIQDSRRKSMEEMQEAAQLQRESGNIIKFVNDNYKDEVTRQIEHHHRLLWSLHPMLQDFINTLEDDWMINALARALGQIGMYQEKKLRMMLYDWIVQKPNPKTMRAVAALLNRIAEHPEHQRFVMEITDEWQKSRHPFGIWAVATTYGMMYDTLKRQAITEPEDPPGAARKNLNTVQENLKKLAQEYADFSDETTQGLQAQTLENLKKEEDALHQLRQDIQYQVQERLENILYEQALKQFPNLNDNARVQLRELVRLENFQPDQRDQLLKTRDDAVQQQMNYHIAQIVTYNVNQQLTVWRYQIIDSLREAMKQISLNHMPDAVTMLIDWLDNGVENSNLWHIARVSSVYLFAASVGKKSTDDQEEDARIFDPRYYQLLDLLPGILRVTRDTNMTENIAFLLSNTATEAMNENDFVSTLSTLMQWLFLDQLPIVTALNAIHDWYDPNMEEDQREEWEREVYRKLLNTTNTARQNKRAYLRQALDIWVKSSQYPLYRIGHAVLARSYIMDGVVMDLPRERYGTVLISPHVKKSGDDYLDAVLSILQHLAALTPVRVYHIGQTKPLAYIGGYDVDETPNKVFDQGVMKAKRQMPHRLMMPTLEDGGLDAENCHFVLVLNTDELRDLPDLLSLAADYVPAREEDELDPFMRQLEERKTEAVEPEQNTWNDPFAQAAAPQAAEESSSTWTDPFASFAGGDAEKSAETDSVAEAADDVVILSNDENWDWERKIFVQTYNTFKLLDDLNIPQEAYEAVRLRTLPRDETLNRRFYEDNRQEIQGLIIKTLSNLPLETWREDINVYQEVPAIEGEDFSPVYDILESWVQKLNDETEAQHPRDITLSIGWTILWLAQQDLNKTILIVLNWLTNEEDGLRQQMGVTCTKLLFNFYGSRYTEATVEKHSTLLTLIPPFMAVNNLYDECTPIIHAVFEWATQETWSNRLVESQYANTTPELMRGMEHIRLEEDISVILQYLTRFEAMERLLALYVECHQAMSFDRFAYEVYRFVVDLEKLAKQRPGVQFSHVEWLQEMEKKNLLPADEIFTDEQLESLISTVLMLPSINQGYLVINYLFNRLGRYPSQTIIHKIEHEMLNRRRVMDAVRIPIYSRIADQLPDLKQDQKYGVVLVDISDLAAREKVAESSHEWVKLFAEQDIENVVLTVHRLGRAAVVSAGTVPTKSEICPPDIPNYAALMGPILDRYPEEQVAFVLIATKNTENIADLEDWKEAHYPIYPHDLEKLSWITNEDEREQLLKIIIEEQV